MSKNPEPPRWYSIKDAAQYLGVGEPTIYRWMRENRITYRKIGDSTRFVQEDLEAMVQVHPSEKDLAKVQDLCPMCHCDTMAPGRIQSTGLIYFRPHKTRFWTLLPADVNTSALMCPRCGYIALFGDTDKLNALRADAAATPPSDPPADPPPPEPLPEPPADPAR